MKNNWIATSFQPLARGSLLAALMTVVMGGIVRVTGSGLGCPDWPMCHGSLIPPWDLPSWIEYLHRLSAAVAGIFIVAMAASGLVLFGAKHKYMRLVFVAVVLLVVQAGLGALTVLSELSPGIALIHTGVATALVGTLSFIVATTSIHKAVCSGADGICDTYKLRKVLMLLAVSTFIVILSGAYVTRSGAASACTAIPLCGVIIEDMISLHWIHMTHRVLVFGLGLMMGVICYAAVKIGDKRTMILAGLMTGLLSMQVLLGIGIVAMGLPTSLRALHLAIAVLFFAFVMLLVGSSRGAYDKDIKGYVAVIETSSGGGVK